MNFIPGLILGVVLTLCKDEIIRGVKNFCNWITSKPWLKYFNYYRLKWRIINKNDIQKKTILYFYEENHLTLKQYDRLCTTYRSMRKLKLITRPSSELKENQQSINMM